MIINIPPDLEQIIDRQLSSGRFADAVDVIRAALTRLVTFTNLDLSTLENRDSLEEVKGELILDLLEKLHAVELFDLRNESPATKWSGSGIQPGKSTVERLPNRTPA